MANNGNLSNTLSHETIVNKAKEKWNSKISGLKILS